MRSDHCPSRMPLSGALAGAPAFTCRISTRRTGSVPSECRHTADADAPIPTPRCQTVARRRQPGVVLRRPGGHSEGPNTRSHPELGREIPQRQWYFVSRRGRVGRCQACQERHPEPPHASAKPHRYIATSLHSGISTQRHQYTAVPE